MSQRVSDQDPVVGVLIRSSSYSTSKDPGVGLDDLIKETPFLDP